jgi:hypothetical protein
MVVIPRHDDSAQPMLGTVGVSAGEQAVAGGSTHRGGNIKIGKPDAFLSEAVNIGRRNIPSITTQVTIPQIIRIHNDDVRVGIRGFRHLSLGVAGEQT